MDQDFRTIQLNQHRAGWLLACALFPILGNAQPLNPGETQAAQHPHHPPLTQVADPPPVNHSSALTTLAQQRADPALAAASDAAATMKSAVAVGAAVVTPVPQGVSLDVSRLAPQKIWLHSAASASHEVVQGSLLTLQPKQLAIVQTGTNLVRQEILGKDSKPVAGFALPFKMFALDAQGKTRSLEACLDTGNGLALHAGTPGYSGKVWIAIQDTEQRNASFDFSAPITVIVTALGLDLAPESLQIAKANDYQAFKVSSLSPPEPATLSARLTGIPSDATAATPVVQVAIPVLKPHLAITLTPPAINGLGLEEATVAVQATGYTDPKDREVRLSAKGHLTDPVLKLNDHGFTQTTIRSAEIGTDVVHATTADASGDSDPLIYRWPLTFLAATFLGALIGAAIERLQSKKPEGTWGRRLLLGSLVGLAFTILFAVGVKTVQWIQPIAQSGEAVIAAIALAGAFGGFRLANVGKA